MAARLGAARRARALPKEVFEIWDVLQTAGDTYLVGGAVRDLVLGRTPHDYDLATSLSPDAAQALLGWKDGPGGRFGSLHAPGSPLEVVSLRAESGYSDRRRPDAVRFGVTLEVDLARRDFTVNAMAMRRDGSIIDPYGGRRDLVRRRIAAVGDPEVRLREDLLRILRAYRFSAQLGFRMSTVLRTTARRLAADLGQVAPERIGEELWRLLEGPAALSALRRAARDGVLGAAAPWRKVPGPR
jgi:tRNA nucleotidyltransferase (CCA-adding enzyme)